MGLVSRCINSNRLKQRGEVTPWILLTMLSISILFGSINGGPSAVERMNTALKNSAKASHNAGYLP